MIEPVVAPQHPLLAVLHAAAAGRFPPVDGAVEYLPTWREGLAAVVSFTGHAYVASSLAEPDFADLAPDGFGRVLAPQLLLRLAGGSGPDAGTVGVIDATLVASGTGAGASSPLVRTTELDEHPRVRHARAIRDDVAVYADERGLITLAGGVAGRAELSVEVTAGRRGGTGVGLLRDALGLAPSGTPVFAAVSPGNARSLRAFLAAGFQVLGSEVTIVTAAGSGWDAMVAAQP